MRVSEAFSNHIGYLAFQLSSTLPNVQTGILSVYIFADFRKPVASMAYELLFGSQELLLL